MSVPLIELQNITKIFPGVKALNDLSIDILSGEVHGLIGENGAGKSTLIKTFTGINKPDIGTIVINGEQTVFNNPIQAKNSGIACVYQELNIVKELSITDNVFMMGYKTKNKAMLDYNFMHSKTKEIMLSLGHDINPKTICGKLGMGILQMVEIGRAILQDAKLIIMDEPTSSLGEKEIQKLMETIKYLKTKGVSILFVSHKLEEIFEVCDRVTVIRDGEKIITDLTENFTKDTLISNMVGRSLDNLFPKLITDKGSEALKVTNLNSVGVFKDISFTAYNGQVLGIAGLVGSSRSELFRAIFGIDKLESGEIYVDGKKIKISLFN